MFYLFSSNHTIRYARDILNVLCYPRGHMVRFRYHESHVAPAVKALKTDSSGWVIVGKNKTILCVLANVLLPRLALMAWHISRYTCWLGCVWALIFLVSLPNASAKAIATAGLRLMPCSQWQTIEPI